MQNGFDDFDIGPQSDEYYGDEDMMDSEFDMMYSDEDEDEDESFEYYGQNEDWT